MQRAAKGAARPVLKVVTTRGKAAAKQAADEWQEF
jgi:hypothetical protein